MTKAWILVGGLLWLVGCGGSNGTPTGGGDMAMGMTASTCMDPTGPGTMHGGSVNTDETWTSAGSPYYLPYDTEITATLTVEPCSVVQLGGGKTITVAAGGSIISKGTEQSPIAWIPKVDGVPWSSIRALGGGTLDLEWTGLIGGGDPLNSAADYAAALDLRADQNLPIADVLHADHLLVQDSASNGIYLHESGGFSATSDGVVVKGSKGYPIHSWSSLLGTIPAGNYTGNTHDEILITATGGPEAISSWDVTIHDRGVPYHVGTTSSGGTMYVGQAAKPLSTLTIEAGVTMRFKKGAELLIEASSGTSKANGALVAVGTAAQPIVFTSAEAAPTAGDWLGIRFGQVPDPSSRMDQTRVEYAGGTTVTGSESCVYPASSLNDAAIRLNGGEPATSFITNTVISDSASHGIDRGFRSDLKPSFLPTNTFNNIARCNETFPRDLSGACPSTVPCPK